MDPLYWEDAYAIALALIECHPEVDFETLHHWVVALPDLDEPALQHRGWLQDIQKEWYEEVSG